MGNGGTMAGESAQEKADGFAARRREALADLGYLRLAVIAAGLAVVAGVAAEIAFGAWWLGSLPIVLVSAAQLGPSQHEVAWRRGAAGERIVGAALDRLARNGVYALHDRLIPGSRANIDHILVGPSGVVTVDAKQYRGELEARREEELWVAGRNRSKLLAQARGQAETVRVVLASHGLVVPVRPALCFVGTEWPLVFPPREVGEVQLVSPRRARRLLAGSAVLDRSVVERIVRVLEDEFRPAAGGAGGARPPNPLHPRDPGLSPQPPGVPGDAPRGTRSPARENAEFTVRRWNRFGHDRLYANLADGRTAGYIDVPTGRVVVELEEFAGSVTPWLRTAREELQS